MPIKKQMDRPIAPEIADADLKEYDPTEYMGIAAKSASTSPSLEEEDFLNQVESSCIKEGKYFLAGIVVAVLSILAGCVVFG